MMENSTETMTTAPKVKKFDRRQSLEDEHKDALERAVSLNIPHAVNPAEDEDGSEPQESPSASDNEDQSSADKLASGHTNSKPRPANWNRLVNKMFERTDSGTFKVRKVSNTTDSHDLEASVS